MASLDDLIRDLARSFELLSDSGSTKFQKKKSLDTIWTKSNEHLGSLAEGNQKEQAKEFFVYSTKHLASRFSDPAEQIREKSIDMVTHYMKNSDELTNSACTAILNCLVVRLAQKEVLEPSEELRLKLALLLDLMVEKLQKDSHLYLPELSQVLVQLLDDPFHEIKKQVSSTVYKLANLTEGHFHPFAEKYIKPLLLNISHQHSRVRKEVIRCIGQIILCGPGKLVDDVIGHLAQRLFDDSPVVREEIINVIGTWLLDLPDRYSFFHKLIPLLLTGINDEIPAISEKASSFWDDIGVKYEKENEEELKDKLDFAAAAPSHYPAEAGGRRPNFGCRALMFRNLSKILPPLSRDLGDWVAATRVKSAELLPLLVLNAEECGTQHLETLLSASYRACADEEPRVRAGVQRALRCLAHFVQPQLWCRLLLPALRRADAQLPSVLTALTCLLTGAHPQLLRQLLPDVAAALAAPEVANCFGIGVKEQHLCCIAAVLDACDTDTASSIADTVYYCVLADMTVPSGSREEADGSRELAADCRRQLAALAEKLQLPDPSCLSALHRQLFPACLVRLKETHKDWTKYSYERAVLDTLCTEAGPVVGAHLPELMEVFSACLHVDKDVELRLKLFLLLGRLCADRERTLDSCGELQQQVPALVSELILPNCRWRAGRTAEAIRKVAATCLWALMESLCSDDESSESLASVQEQLLPALGSLMEDDEQETRLLSCRCLTSLLAARGRRMDGRQLHEFYPQLLKRLDDTRDSVRVAACAAFRRWLLALSDDFDPTLYSAHLEDIYRGLLVHLDDQEPDIQRAVYDVLSDAGRLHPQRLRDEVERVRHKHRDDCLLARLLAALPDQR